MFVIIIMYAYFISILQGSVETHLRYGGPRPVESHSGSRGNILMGPQTFSRAPLGRKYLKRCGARGS